MILDWYLNRKEFAMAENILQKFKRFYADIERDVVPNASVWTKAFITADFLWEKIRYDTELIDYVQYRFYYKKRSERNKFINHGKLLQIIKTCNDPKSRKLFDQKPLFNKEFSQYLGRDWVDSAYCTKEEFMRFFNAHEAYFCKSPDGMFGRGIEIVKRADIKKPDAFYKKCVKNKTLLEEILVQSPQLAAFNNTAVNSLRMVTLVCADNTVRVMAAVLRISRKGKFADNFHHEGIAALIDIKTGIVYTTGVDRNWNRYVLHPDSKKQIVGFKVPHWSEIINTVKKAAMVHPEVRYVGWDVMIKENGQIVLIEGNPGADPDVTQIEDQVGKWPLYEPLLKEIAKANGMQLNS